MGAEPWSYFVAFESSVETALSKLRQRVFKAGRFRGAEQMPTTPEEAFENSGDCGTASILDITHVSEGLEFCSVCPLSNAQLMTYFGTSQPTHEMVASQMAFYEHIQRGQGIYMTVFKDSQPDEYFFAGYSFD